MEIQYLNKANSDLKSTLSFVHKTHHKIVNSYIIKNMKYIQKIESHLRDRKK